MSCLLHVHFHVFLRSKQSKSLQHPPLVLLEEPLSHFGLALLQYNLAFTRTLGSSEPSNFLLGWACSNDSPTANGPEDTVPFLLYLIVSMTVFPLLFSSPSSLLLSPPTSLCTFRQRSEGTLGCYSSGTLPILLIETGSLTGQQVQENC